MTPALDVALVRRLVDAQFPQWRGLPIARVARGGHDHRTFHLGGELLVRLPSAPAYAAQVDKEQRWLPVLAPQLPLPIPAPVGHGRPDAGYPHAWSVYRWLPGEDASETAIDEPVAFARDLAAFLRALQAIDASDGPPAGEHNFWRGGPLRVYAHEVDAALARRPDGIDRAAVLRVWHAALAADWAGAPVWVHGDVAVGNLLVRDGRLAAVIDFGSSGVGDPACDLVIAWTLFAGAARRAFADAMDADAATWDRARGWALWKALITLDGSDPRPRRDIARLLE